MELVNFDSIDDNALNEIKDLTDSIKASFSADKIYTFNEQLFKKHWYLSRKGYENFSDELMEIIKHKMPSSTVYNIVLEECHPCEIFQDKNLHSSVSRIDGIRTTQMITQSLPKGSGTFLWHQDENTIENSFKTFLYLNDSNKDNGCICLAQGRPTSNFSSLYDNLTDIKSEYIEGDAGSLITFSTRILHRQHLPVVNMRETLQFYRKLK